jgi:hypothetical protein
MPYADLYDELRKLVNEKSFTVHFIKADKTERTMKCHLTDEGGAQQLHRGRITVIDEEVDNFRYINLNTLVTLTFEGKTYKIKEEKWVIQ